jgi:hypothetical protein
MDFFVSFGLFLFLFFAGLGVMLVGAGILKWGEAQKLRYANGK